MMNTDKSTRCVHAGKATTNSAQGVTTPIYTSTAYRFPGESGEVVYPRYFNVPTQEVVADKIRQLEGGEQGLVFSSGMAAITSTLLANLKQGDHAVFHSGIYGGSRSFIARFLENFGIAYSIVYASESAAFADEIRDNTKLIFFETPTNPLLSVIDIRAIVELAKQRQITTAIDNTFGTPICQEPIPLGVDIVIHSGTKYLNGHSDVNCGAVVSTRQRMKDIVECAVHLGGTLDVRACYLLERGLKTLAVRVDRQCANALQLAKFLESHDLVRKVNYPGLPSHAGHSVAARQMNGFGGMLSFELNVDGPTAKRMMNRLRVATMAISLGGVETLVCFPCDTSHAKMTAQQRHESGISDGLVRVSTGIEKIDDLIADFASALR